MTASRIAIDGPAGAGKTVVGSELACRLRYLFFDTGAMYRALGLLARRAGASPDDSDVLMALLPDHTIAIRPASVSDGRRHDVLIDGVDATWDIRDAATSDAASRVAVHPPVRRWMVGVQTEYGASGHIVMAGRDIGTIVMPTAELKIFLTASLEERGHRRAAELRGRGVDVDRRKLVAELADRDRRDRERLDSPLRKAADAVELNTDGRSIKDVVEKIERLARAIPG